MGQLRSQRPVMLVCAIISRHADAFAWATERLTREFDEIEMSGELFEFNQTSFYQRTMGEGLQKKFLGFKQLIDPEKIVEAKLLTNELEKEYAQMCGHPEQRPLNLDPGYITEAKLVLATTKDRDHRIYLREGIFAEVTLYYQGDCWKDSHWTYPDYRLPASSEFFLRCRGYLRRRYQQIPRPDLP